MTGYRVHESEPIRVHPSGQITVTARPVRAGHQIAPEVGIKDRGVETVLMSPDGARALADALRAAADTAEGAAD